MASKRRRVKRTSPVDGSTQTFEKLPGGRLRLVRKGEKRQRPADTRTAEGPSDPSYFADGSFRFNPYFQGRNPQCIEDLGCPEAAKHWPKYVSFWDPRLQRLVHGPAPFGSTMEKQLYYRLFGFAEREAKTDNGFTSSTERVKASVEKRQAERRDENLRAARELLGQLSHEAKRRLKAFLNANIIEKGSP